MYYDNYDSSSDLHNKLPVSLFTHCFLILTKYSDFQQCIYTIKTMSHYYYYNILPSQIIHTVSSQLVTILFSYNNYSL